MSRQCTLGRVAELEGVGLHTGAPVRMRLVPAEVGSGRVFVRTDLAEAPVLPARLETVTSTVRGTNIGEGEATVHTVEHVLSALAGSGVDNARVELDGPEPPAVDGSALPFVHAIDEAGVKEQDAPAPEVRLASPLHHRADDAEIVYMPGDGLRITFNIDFRHPQLPPDAVTIDVNRDSFRAEVAPARTFCLEHEVEVLRKAGLIQGGSLENAIVVGDSGILNESPLRMEGEFARHKLLDLVGDLALLPGRLQGHVVAFRSGHETNVAFARRFVQAMTIEGGGAYDIGQIKEFLPHRYPFLMLDRVEELEPGKRLVGLKNVTVDEPFFQGHFPAEPVMPGVLLLEGMAQAGAFIVYHSRPDFRDKLIFFTGIDKCRFRNTVVPGDQVRYTIEVRRLQRVSLMTGRAHVGSKLVCEANLQAMVVDRNEAKGEGA